MPKQINWVKRWGMWLVKTSLPGVYRRRAGGHYVRGRVVDPRSDEMITIEKSLPGVEDQKEALAQLQGLRRDIKEGKAPEKRSKPRFAAYADALFARKIRTGEIKSEAGREKWTYALVKLIEGVHDVPGFGAFYIDRIRHADCVEWHEKVGRLVTSKVYKPNYVNDWIAIMRVVMKAAVAEFELPRNPMEGIKNIDKALHRTYTREAPNSFLTPEVRLFLPWVERRFPQHFAYVMVGLGLGQRECTLRPLRRKGPSADYLPEERLLLIRRSHTRGQVVMDMTKTKRDQTIPLPPAILRVLAWHVKTQMTTDAMKNSDLLFPAEDGGFRGPRDLRRLFEAAESELKLSKTVTGRALRRTFQDLTREAEVDAFIAKAISGHATDAMREHYSTARDVEVARGIAKVISLAGVRASRGKRSTG